MKGISKWLKLIIEVFFLPTYVIYLLYDYLSGFEGHLVYLTLILGFLYDVAMGYGLLFTMFAIMLVLIRHGYISLGHYDIFVAFTLAWLVVLIYRGFPSFYIFMAMALFVWEVYSSARKKRLVY